MALTAYCLAASLLTPASQAPGGEVIEVFRVGPSAQNYANWGCSAASLGDVNGDHVPDLVIGARNALNSVNISTGAAFVYSGADGSLIRVHYGALNGSWFGAVVLNVGDVDLDGTADYVIGAPYRKYQGSSDSGSWHCYSGADGSPLSSGFGAGYDRLGYHLAALGDLDLDGSPDFAVSSSRRVSAEYVRLVSGRSGSTIRELTTGLFGDSFGVSVSSAGDADLDGVSDIIVGAPATPLGGGHQGRVYLYSGASGVLLRATDCPANFSHFGFCVEQGDDYDLDGFDEHWATAWGYPNSGPLLLSGATGAVLLEILRPHGLHLGELLCADADLDGDGVRDLLTAERLGGNLTQNGRVFVYSGADGSLLRIIDGLQHYAEFGTALGVSEDRDGDGMPDFFATEMTDTRNAKLRWFANHPYLDASRPRLSASAGGNQRLSLTFPPALAGQRYRVLLSARGAGPFTYEGVDYPLTPDLWTLRTLRGQYWMLPASSGMSGRLDATGAAHAVATFPPGSATRWIGSTIHFAAVVFPSGAGTPVTSVSRGLTFHP